MKMKINYIDNEIEFYDTKINVIEIENKKYFYKFIKDLYNLSNNFNVENISFFSENLNELNYNGKINLFLNYLDFDNNSKKYINDISKIIIATISDGDRDIILKQYNKLEKLYSKLLVDFNLPLIINTENPIDNISKVMKIQINYHNDLLDNLLLLIDLEKIIKKNQILIFINLKQYLNKEELIELYKYSIYNEVKIMLIDSQCYGVTIDYEKKLIIDSNMDEFVL